MANHKNRRETTAELLAKINQLEIEAEAAQNMSIVLCALAEQAGGVLLIPLDLMDAKVGTPFALQAETIGPNLKLSIRYDPVPPGSSRLN